MAWLKVEGRMPQHPKVLRSGAQLGAGTLGRVLGLWMVGSCYSVEHLTDGFVPAAVLEDPRYDRQPKKVIAAMIAVNLLEHAPGGFKVHDFNDYNPLGLAVLEKRKADAARKRGEQPTPGPSTLRVESARIPNGGVPESERIPNGVHTDSATIPNGIHVDSAALAGAYGRARPTPTPTPKTKVKSSAAGAAPRARQERTPAESPQVLAKLAHTVLDDIQAGSLDAAEAKDELKTRAARAGIRYDGDRVRKALDSAEAQRTLGRADSDGVAPA